MEVNDVLAELFGRIPSIVRAAVDGLAPDELVTRPASHTNPIGWLVWHLTRVQDHHLADLIGENQLWVTGDWAGRFGLEPETVVGSTSAPSMRATTACSSSSTTSQNSDTVKG